MARLVDLEVEEHEPEAKAGGKDDSDVAEDNPNIGAFSAALTCYP